MVAEYESGYRDICPWLVRGQSVGSNIPETSMSPRGELVDPCQKLRIGVCLADVSPALPNCLQNGAYPAYVPNIRGHIDIRGRRKVGAVMNRCRLTLAETKNKGFTIMELKGFIKFHSDWPCLALF
ncbi:hypothetical protein RF11_14171 [Thelohanellus kitauei]|uniref:Uncharacterized protein n=1 Tax=Thelohanellus kitauei TaxID=669202 RepID=A0A0C2MY76_THEKT|nr:hypothetical protein RF11_14171 [Thelohanellus kitauei]